MIPISRPLIGEDEKVAVMAALSSGQLAQGPRVREFEEKFAAWAGVKHAVATSSGTTALHVAMLAHGLNEGDEVITTSFSFIASANCALYAGAKPVFADIEPNYFSLDPVEIEKKITPRTKAIVVVHLFGQSCNMGAIAALAAKHNLVVVEDACQSHGAKFNGKMVGSWGTACYSFYPTKNMTTIEGGMLTTNDSKIAEQARLIREHGSPKRYLHERLGFNFRMTDPQAAVGLGQLQKLDGWNEQRRANAAYLTARLAGVAGVTPPPIRDSSGHVFHQYTIRVVNREAVIERLTQRGVGYGIYYPMAIHQQPLYQKLGYNDHLPNTEAACREVLSLPVHPSLSQADLDCIVDAVTGR
ncbi:MAG: DegT/DnrJ/EryC1/StrS family aminotransferase [Chloroflexi bacterium]|nr:DegT/DnrJ/EryC1/StrS family aminotransferase [Chloroflexota bacterium]